MADRPLRPATHRTLGGPLPRQLGLNNGPQAHLLAHCCFDPWAICGISTTFVVLFPTKRQITYVLRTRSPLVLLPARLACVKPSASVRSEPGSNSPIFSTGVDPYISMTVRAGEAPRGLRRLTLFRTVSPNGFLDGSIHCLLFKDRPRSDQKTAPDASGSCRGANHRKAAAPDRASPTGHRGEPRGPGNVPPKLRAVNDVGPELSDPPQAAPQ